MNASLAGSGNEYSDTEHMFVSVEQAHSSRGFDELIRTDSLDPLDLSQGAILEPEPELGEQLPQSIATPSLLQTKSLEPSTTEANPDPTTPTKSDPPRMSPMPSPLTLPPELGTVALDEKSDDDKLEDTMSEDGKSDDEKSDTCNDDDDISGNSKPNEVPEEDIHKKYAALLVKYQKKSEKLKQLQKNHCTLKRKYAEVKDTLVYTVSEAKKDRMNQNSSIVSII